MAEGSEYCADCGRKRHIDEHGCPLCGADVYTEWSEGEPVVDAPELSGEPLLGPVGQVLQLGRGYVALVYGGPGIGKTSLCLQAFDSPTVATLEMSVEQARAYCRRLGVRAFEYYTELDWEDEWLGLGLEPRELVVDSVQEAATHIEEGGATEVTRRLIHWAERTSSRVLLIGQVTKDGTVAGSNKVPHMVGAVVGLEFGPTGARTVFTDKNRFGELARATFALEADAPVAARYYSVEGKSGRYALVPFPSPDSGYYAGLLRLYATESDGGRRRLPDPPAAVAALPAGALYPGEWIEPVDAPQRATFARDNGVPYFNAETWSVQ